MRVTYLNSIYWLVVLFFRSTEMWWLHVFLYLFTCYSFAFWSLCRCLLAVGRQEIVLSWCNGILVKCIQQPVLAQVTSSYLAITARIRRKIITPDYKTKTSHIYIKALKTYTLYLSINWLSQETWSHFSFQVQLFLTLLCGIGKYRFVVYYQGK